MIQPLPGDCVSACMRARKPDVTPEGQVIAFFILFIIVVTYTMLPIIIAVMLDNFSTVGLGVEGLVRVPSLPRMWNFPFGIRDESFDSLFRVLSCPSALRFSLFFFSHLLLPARVTTSTRTFDGPTLS